MRVQNISYTPHINNNFPQYHTRAIPYDSVTFSGKTEDEQYLKAQRYANRQKILNIILGKDFSRYNLDKLEGIQHGIKIFEGLNMNEIAFMFNNLQAIAVKRGCSNQCLHCYANALPPEKEHDNYINKMKYEEFLELTNGIKTLRERIGASQMINKEYVDMFYDADCMEIVLYDQNGKEHDLTELCDKFYDATNKKMVFDTVGWNYKNPKMQKRAEKYVEYLCDLDNAQKFYQVNLSINPFNSIYAKAIKLGFNPENYNPENQPTSNIGEKLYNLYINRTVNMMLTFAPLLNTTNFGIISRIAKEDNPYIKDFNIDAYMQNVTNILNRLRKVCIYDYNNEQKFIKNEFTISYYINEYSRLLTENIDDDLIASERLKKIYFEKEPKMTQKLYENHYPEIFKFRYLYEQLKKEQDLNKLNVDYSKVVDTNGKLYLYDGYRFIPTEISLNLSTKDKITPKLSPQVVDDFIVTREMINKKADT